LQQDPATMDSVAMRELGSLEESRSASRRLLAEDIPPEQTNWLPPGQAGNLLSRQENAALVGAPPSRATGHLTVSKKFLALATLAICHADEERFALLYRLLWRLTHGEPRLMTITSDPLVHRVDAMAKAVRRDRHKMTAFVRFRAVQEDDDEIFVSWFEPSHYIVELTAPFFVRRFTGMNWSILTPYRSAHWNRENLTFGSGASKDAFPDVDTIEDLWKSYYRSIFNPARPKARAMQAEMPKKYWKNLPEAALIPALTRSALPRTRKMCASGGTNPSPRGRTTYRSPHAAVSNAAPGAPHAAPSIQALRSACHACTSCTLHAPATQVVFGEGPERADIMIVGEQPGDHEDLCGRPFVGPAGQLLDTALRQAGLSREALYLTNAVKHFGFLQRGKRRMHKTPKTAEIDACLPWLEREIAVVQPRVIVAMGRSAGRAVFGTSGTVKDMRGTLTPSRFGLHALLTWHPSYMLRIRDDGHRETVMSQFVADLSRTKSTAIHPLPLTEK